MLRKRFRITLVALLTVGSLTLVALKEPGERYFEIAKNLDIFGTLFKELNTYYVDEVNPNEVIKTGIDAMLRSLDPYTNYIPEDEIEDYMTMTTGQYGGIGAYVGQRNGRTLIIMPYDGSPAQKAGLKISDELLKIDGVDLKGKNQEGISKLLKGQANTTVKLLIRRYGQTAPQEVALTRENIKINNVPYYGMVNDEVGYIALKDFTTGAGREVKTALLELKNKGAKKLVFDLRGNPGGLLSEAVNVSNVFVPKDAEIVSTKGKVVDWNKTYTALNPPVDLDMPVVVLLSGGTASAAEIVSGVIQDYDRGVLVGQRSFGKGLVQATRSLSYNSKLKITTAKYYIPSGRCIQALDYTHRNPDGTVNKFADSLHTAFRTRNGRVVYDGGGVTPDLDVPRPVVPAIATSLDTKNLFFDYANVYFVKHPTIKPAKEFSLTEVEYNEFVKWLDNKEYDYTTQVEKNISELEATAKKEKYYDSIQEQLKALKTRVYHNKESDLQKFKADIKPMIEEEIVARYYLQRGVQEAAFAHDPDVLAALAVLKDADRYARLLKGGK